MESICAPSPYFGTTWLGVEVKQEGREEIHKKLDVWLDEVEEMMVGGLEEVTKAIFEKRQELMGEIAEHIIKERYSEELERETAICPGCGRELKRKGMRDRTVVTMVGGIKLNRPYFWCENCKYGFSPLDEALKLADAEKQWDVQRAGASLAAETSYAVAEDLFKELTGISMSDYTMHELVEKVCEGVDVLDVAPSAYEIKEKAREVGEGKKWRPVMVLAIDGADVPTRPEDAKDKWRGRKKLRAKRAKWEGEWREAKGFRFYLVKGERIEHILSWHQVQSSEGLKEGLKKVKEAGLIPEDDVRLCVIGDGARWIWNTINELYPKAVEVLDYYHASEHIYKAAEVLYCDPESAQEWAEATLTRLFLGEIEVVIEELGRMNAEDEKVKKEIESLSGYLKENKDRMNYKRVKKGGYPIGSGGIEASNKTICHVRLKRSGAWWYVENANYMLALRCAKYNGTFKRIFTKYAQKSLQKGNI